MDSKKVYYILVTSVVLVIFITIILVVRGLGGKQGDGAVIQFWGVYDENRAFEKVRGSFEAQNPGVKVVYRLFSYEDYEKNLVDALAAGTGPDVFMIQNTWLPKHGDKLKALPTTKLSGQKQPFTIQNFKDQFVDVAFNDLTLKNQIYAMPLYVDTLALYYNKDLVNSAGITRPPQDWEEFNSDVEALTRLGIGAEITQSGAAIGTARNVNRSTDVLMALMLQSGVRMTSQDNLNATFSRPVENASVGEVALKYYTDFANPSVRTYSWNDGQHYSIDAFIEGKTAMMFNYSHQIGVLRGKAARLNFAVAPMPQISSTDIKNYANYWAVGVANNSKYSDQAWKFIIALTSTQGATDYLSSVVRPSARRDIIELQKSDLDLGVFANQALSARSWFQIENVAIEGIFADMIDDVNFHRMTARDSLQNAESRVNVLMRKR